MPEEEAAGEEAAGLQHSPLPRSVRRSSLRLRISPHSQEVKRENAQGNNPLLPSALVPFHHPSSTISIPTSTSPSSSSSSFSSSLTYENKTRAAQPRQHQPLHLSGTRERNAPRGPESAARERLSMAAAGACKHRISPCSSRTQPKNSLRPRAREQQGRTPVPGAQEAAAGEEEEEELRTPVPSRRQRRTQAAEAAAAAGEPRRRAQHRPVPRSRAHSRDPPPPSAPWRPPVSRSTKGAFLPLLPSQKQT